MSENTSTYMSFQEAAGAVSMEAPAVDPVVETQQPVSQQPPAVETPPANDGGQQPPANEPPKKQEPADDFYARFAEKFGNPEIKDEETFTKWKAEASKPKEPEYPTEFAKQQAEYLKGAKDEAEARQRLIEFNFYTITNWEEKTKTDEGMNDLIRIGHRLENPGMTQKALEFSLNDFMAKHPTDVEELREAGEQDPEGRAEFNKHLLIQKAQATLDKIYAKRGLLAEAVKKASDPVGEARAAYVESAKTHLGSFKLGSGDIEYAMAEKDVAELSTPEAYNAFTSKLSDPGYVAKLMAADKFLSGGGLEAMIKKAIDKGTNNIVSKMSNTAVPGTADIPDTGKAIASSFREAAQAAR